MLGEIITRIDQPHVADKLLACIDPIISEQIAKRAAHHSMTPGEFAAGAVREFVERADDNLWFQLMTHMRKAEDPGLVAVQTILQWVVTERDSV